VNKLIISQSEFNGYVQDICRNITNSNWRPDYIVGITRGGLLPALMISQYMQVPMQTIHISLRDADASPESNLWMAEDAFEGKKILVVDDINDTGATINWLVEDWPSGCFPDDEKWPAVWNNNVRFAVVVDNLASKCKAYMDYFSFEVNKADDDVWIEFPYEEWWRK
jgi:xanthine phosphoribosyltransferase